MSRVFIIKWMEWTQTVVGVVSSVLEKESDGKREKESRHSEATGFAVRFLPVQLFQQHKVVSNEMNKHTAKTTTTTPLKTTKAKIYTLTQWHKNIRWSVAKWNKNDVLNK